MQKRKPGQPHKGWKAAARKSRRRKPNKIVQGLFDAIQAKVRKGHTPWNDPDPDNRASDDGMPMNDVGALIYGHDAGIPSDANEVLNAPWPPFTCEDAKPFIDPHPGSVRDPSEVVADMKAQRAAPKGPFAPSPYTKESEDASKMRERLTDCFTILAKAIEKVATAIVAGRDLPESPLEMPPVERPESTWNAVGKGTPLNVWLETKYVSMTMYGIKHRHANICKCIIQSIGAETEWVEKKSGHSTVTHPDSLVVPTHWRWLVTVTD